MQEFIERAHMHAVNTYSNLLKPEIISTKIDLISAAFFNANAGLYNEQEVRGITDEVKEQMWKDVQESISKHAAKAAKNVAKREALR
mmetsp:Transcript_49521/g.143675  ORF Transcript_49521/g.143675 Transcript_49521/m.143675 type:complete len:87 (-) Transcript_49521:1065-1325(-)